MIIPWRRRSLLVAAAAVAMLVSLTLVGCGLGRRPGPLAPQFNVQVSPRTQKPMAADPLSGADQPGALFPSVDPELAPDGRAPEAAPLPRLSPAVQENVTAPGEAAARAAEEAGRGPDAALEVTEPAVGPSLGEYLTVGGVVAEVNGVPIYAHRVLNLIEPVLAARAKELEPQQFRALATYEVRRQVADLRDHQLEYAAAAEALDEKDKALADALTEQWRNQQIVAAGGSIELAKRRSAARGDDFDELVQQQYRLNMSRIYYQKRVVLRIQVTGSDMRQYYAANRDREFTERGKARFRLINVDARKSGGREEALARITDVRNRILKAGEPFDAIARTSNDDPRLQRSGGDLGAAIEEGAFFNEQVEQAVWRTPEGQLTEIIDAGDAFYLALVEEKIPGRVLPFEDEQVQQRIRATLESEQFRALRQQNLERLAQQATIKSTPQMLNIAVEMAMQNYPRWSGRQG